jgi:flagellar hook assembly protein FlgD
MINYYIPESAGHAFIKVTNMNGQEIKTIQLSGTGSGQITLQTATLSSGNYTYALYVDGNLIDTKIMVLAR